MIIKSNIEAMQTYVNLTKIDSAFNKSLAKISTGLELPKPEFGGGFFAVANDMEALYKQYNIGAQNIADALGFLEVAQTTMLQLNDGLLQMAELAQRAATDTVNNDQRQEMASEVSQILMNMSNLVSTVKFNELSVFAAGGSANTISVQYGSDRSFSVNVLTMGISATGLGVSGVNLSTQVLASTALGSINSAVIVMGQYLARMGSQINYVQSKLDIQNETALQQKSMESRINELDFAKEMKNFTSLQVVLQASNAMVAQANTKAQMVLQLFGG